MKSFGNLATGVAVAAIVSIFSATGVSASEREPEDIGGWSEDQSVIQRSSGPDGPLVAYAGGAKHSGKAEEKTIKGTTHKRSHGWTTWKGVKHYTTARLEHYWPNKGVIASSGRKYGTGKSEAMTKWVRFNPNAKSNGYGKARTYYGR